MRRLTDPCAGIDVCERQGLLTHTGRRGAHQRRPPDGPLAGSSTQRGSQRARPAAAGRARRAAEPMRGRTAQPCRVPEFAGVSDLRFQAAGFVLVDQPAEDRSTPDPLVPEIRDRRFWMWRAQLQRSMRPSPVVVSGVVGKHPAEVPLSEDQHPVGELGSDGQHDAFGEAVRPRQRGGILTTSMPASNSTASNEAAN
jgi:hypothetical protein